MKKLRLDLDHLRVESFDTSGGGAAPRGTVRGAARHPTLEESYDPSCLGGDSCDGSCGDTCLSCDASCINGTCYASCNGTCAASCNGTCVASCYGSCDVTCETCGGTCYESCHSCWGSRAPMECCL